MRAVLEWFACGGGTGQPSWSRYKLHLDKALRAGDRDGYVVVTVNDGESLEAKARAQLARRLFRGTRTWQQAQARAQRVRLARYEGNEPFDGVMRRSA